MAEQKLPEAMIKSFQSVQFGQMMENKYDVRVEFNANEGSISLKFMNKTNAKTYHQSFNKEKINEIVSRCQLSTENLSQVIIDQLSSSELTQKFLRIYISPDPKQGNVCLM